MIRAVVYFHGPKTAWQRKVAEIEIIASRAFPSLWLGRLWARATIRPLDAGRCGYALVDAEGREIEHVGASITDFGPAEG